MKSIMEQISGRMKEAFSAAGYDPKYGEVKVSDRPDLCEYQCNGAMAAAKAYHKAPFQIADDVVAQLNGETDGFTAEAVRPGRERSPLPTGASCILMRCRSSIPLFWRCSALLWRTEPSGSPGSLEPIPFRQIL